MTTSASTAGRRPHVRCRRPEGGQVLPEPGTVVRASDGAVVVFVGDAEGLVDVAALAPQLRQARSVELVGDVWQAARPVKFALGEAWSEATRAAREASRPPALPKAPPHRCGRPRKDGQPCRQWAGAGTDSPGAGPCSAHGGPTVQKQAEARHVAEQGETLARLAAKTRAEPLTARERLQALEAFRDVLTASRKPRRRSRNPMSRGARPATP